MAGTRIAVRDVIRLLQNGQTVESITANRLPMLTTAQVYACLAIARTTRRSRRLVQMAHDEP